MQKIVATIEARMTSTRLPGKILMPILGKPILELMIERVLRSKYIDEVVIATTTNDSDDEVVALAKKLGVGCYRGSEDDVLDRVLKAAKAYDATIIVELTGDCPLIDPGVIDHIIEIYVEKRPDYASNTIQRTYPRGLDTEIFSVENLDIISRITNDLADREHVSLYFYEHPDDYELINVESSIEEEWWDLRLTVDTIEDFTLISKIYEALYPKRADFTIDDIICLFRENKNLKEINQHIKQKRVR